MAAVLPSACLSVCLIELA